MDSPLPLFPPSLITGGTYLPPTLPLEAGVPAAPPTAAPSGFLAPSSSFS